MLLLRDTAYVTDTVMFTLSCAAGALTRLEFQVQFDDPQLGVRKIMDSSVMPHPPGLQLPLFPEPSAAPPPIDQLGLAPNAAVLAMQLQSMLGLLGVHVAVALPPPFCVIPHWLPQKYQPAVAVAARALRDHMLQAGTTVGGEPALEVCCCSYGVRQ